MLVLSRQVHETVLIGDTISVTVVSIGAEITTLFVRYRDETQRVEQKLALEVDDRLEITNDIHVHIVEIRDDEVRLGVVAPATFSVHRKEAVDAIKRKSSGTSSESAHSFALHLHDVLLVGEHLQLIVARTASGDRQLRSRGQLLGGPRDGEEFKRGDPISVGSTLEFGSLVQVRVVEITTESVGLKIEHPMHMICRIKE